MDRNLFMPRSYDGRHRFRFELAEGEILKVGRGRPWGPVVLQLVDGRKIRVRGAPCSLGRCYCDAVLLRGPE